jgi:hypothetical protein
MRFIAVYMSPVSNPSIEVGVGTNILKIRIMDDTLYFYCDVDTRDRKRTIQFKIFKNGDHIIDKNIKYIDTIFDGLDGYHIYQIIE